MKRRDLQVPVTSSPFDMAVSIALAEISPNNNTRLEYRRDFDIWIRFCNSHRFDPKAPVDGAVAAWIETMKKAGHAPKSRTRRMSSLSSIYRELRRKKVVSGNPFSVDDGPRREKAAALAPTRIAAPDIIKKLLAACDDTPTGLRDVAIIRVLWSTGMRRISLLSMTLERLQKDRSGLVAVVDKKGGDTQRVLIRGRAREALDKWLAILEDGTFKKGPIWRLKNGKPMSLRELNRVMERRGKGLRVSPHMLRVSFLTYNPAGLEAKQEAAGHADPATTRMYDRESWRGREAFEKMPEIEDVDE